jgi:segregation and condensation protein A
MFQTTQSDVAPTSYVVKLPLFEGPLDLLLHLIQKNELDITVISLGLVADQFVEHLHSLAEVRAEVIADFLVVAAKLLLIKSRLLLPRPVLREEDEEEDPGEALARRLKEYKRFKQAAGMLKAIEDLGRPSYVRVAPPPPMEARLDLEGLSLDDLIAALRQLAQGEQETQPAGNLLAPRKVTVREKIDWIAQLMAKGHPVPFSQVVGLQGARVDIVVSLWAVLELIKRGRLRVHQAELFGEIVLVDWLAGEVEV